MLREAPVVEPPRAKQSSILNIVRREGRDVRGLTWALEAAKGFQVVKVCLLCFSGALFLFYLFFPLKTGNPG